jgi:hypothetical protein
MTSTPAATAIRERIVLLQEWKKEGLLLMGNSFNEPRSETTLEGFLEINPLSRRDNRQNYYMPGRGQVKKNRAAKKPPRE